MTYGGALDSRMRTPKVDGRPQGPPLRVFRSSWLGVASVHIDEMQAGVYTAQEPDMYG